MTVADATAGRWRAREDLRPAYSAVRMRRGLVALLVALAAAGWWWTAGQMKGMDNGPWTDLGTFGWFISVWVVMMAAMMFPSVSPTVALYSKMTSQRSPWLPLLFAGGYLVAWTAAGVVAFAIHGAIDTATGNALHWDHAGRWVAGATLLFAAIYQWTPFKDACLAKCRSPLGFLLGSWRDGPRGALTMGTKHGAWCVGCCFALMAALFALGIMSVTWMAVVAAFIALEKMVPWRGLATHGTAAILLALGALVLLAPSAIPGLTTPSNTPMSPMKPAQPMQSSMPNGS
jgi:predicted metal-binding membrane protein